MQCAVGRPVLVGPHTYNFAEAADSAIATGAALRVETADGRQLFRRLAATADVILETFPPGFLAALGLSYDSLGAQHPGDPDLLMHYVACRAAGIVVRGPPPAELVGEVARVDVLGYLEVELRWALHDAPEAYGVLNACRKIDRISPGLSMLALTPSSTHSPVCGFFSWIMLTLSSRSPG